MKIPGCHLDGGWNPRKNITYVQDGIETWYNFPRSAEDFHEKINKRLISCHDIESPDFIFAEYVQFVVRMHAAFGDNVHIIPTEMLYKDTEKVLGQITELLEIDKHDFSAVASLSVNVNGNPGIDSVQEKTRGDYPPVSSKVIEETMHAVESVATFIHDISGHPIHESWGLMNRAR